MATTEEQQNLIKDYAEYVDHVTMFLDASSMERVRADGGKPYAYGPHNDGRGNQVVAVGLEIKVGLVSVLCMETFPATAQEIAAGKVDLAGRLAARDSDVKAAA